MADEKMDEDEKGEGIDDPKSIPGAATPMDDVQEGKTTQKNGPPITLPAMADEKMDEDEKGEGIDDPKSIPGAATPMDDVQEGKTTQKNGPPITLPADGSSPPWILPSPAQRKELNIPESKWQEMVQTATAVLSDDTLKPPPPSRLRQLKMTESQWREMVQVAMDRSKRSKDVCDARIDFVFERETKTFQELGFSGEPEDLTQEQYDDMGEDEALDSAASSVWNELDANEWYYEDEAPPAAGRGSSQVVVPEEDDEDMGEDLDDTRTTDYHVLVPADGVPAAEGDEDYVPPAEMDEDAEEAGEDDEGMEEDNGDANEASGEIDKEQPGDHQSDLKRARAFLEGVIADIDEVRMDDGQDMED